MNPYKSHRAPRGRGFFSNLKKAAGSAMNSSLGQAAMAQAQAYALQKAQEVADNRGIPVDVASMANMAGYPVSGQGITSDFKNALRRAGIRARGRGFFSNLKKAAGTAMNSSLGQAAMAQAQAYALQKAQEVADNRGIPVDVASMANMAGYPVSGQGFGNRIRKPHQVKGSAEAKAHMARLRAMRMRQ